ncbi:hypothetical protein TNCV_2214021 [Trichonephila clavipes]|nr:hypothetical protein TNCV_2214021 [Trichonephila clavipes]
MQPITIMQFQHSFASKAQKISVAKLYRLLLQRYSRTEIRLPEEVMHVKSIMPQSPPCWHGVNARRRKDQFRCHPSHLTKIQKDEVHRQ